MKKTKKLVFKINNGNLFFGKFQALKNINLEVNQGEKIAIIGHNGAGKSILVDVITGSKKLTSGKVSYFNDEKINKMKEKMGVLLQTKEFFQGVKLKSFLTFYLNVYNLKIKDDWVLNLLKQFKVSHLLNFFLRNLSGGQQQKVNIVISLLNKPNILFVDEILTSLDISAQNEVLNCLKKYVDEKKNFTLVSVSHNEKEITTLTNRIIVLKNGQITNDLTKKELLKNHGSILDFMKKLESVKNA